MTLAYAKPPKRERLVPKGERKAITARMKAEAWEATDGCCYICGAKVPMTGPGVEYDHKLPLWLHGKHNVANIGPACPDPCHKAKTRREAPIRAKVVRIQKRRAGEEKAKRPIPSPGFNRTLTKGFDGKVRPRSVRAKKPEDGRLTGSRDDLETPISRASGRGER